MIRDNKLAALAVVLFVLLSIGTIWQDYQNDVNLRAETERAEARASELANTQALSTRQTRALIRQLREEGQVPVVSPDDVPESGEVIQGSPGAQGIPGATGPGPSATQVSAAVTLYCDTTGACNGLRPTAGQVAAAVTQYCDARGECQGPQGIAGTDGTNGVDGTDGANGLDGANGADGAQGPAGPEGPAGPAPTDMQVMNAVSSYCNNTGACKGDPGTVPDGSYLCPDGQFSRGFTVQNGQVNVVCTADGIL